jgi:hypothetical protein
VRDARAPDVSWTFGTFRQAGNVTGEPDRLEWRSLRLVFPRVAQATVAKASMRHSRLAEPRGVAVQILTLEHFASRVHETFTVDLGHGKSPFVLIEAKPLAAPAIRGMVRAPFSLLFHHVSPVLFPQRIYQMESPGIGDFGVFLVPVARNQDGFLYQAVFN